MRKLILAIAAIVTVALTGIGTASAQQTMNMCDTQLALRQFKSACFRTSQAPQRSFVSRGFRTTGRTIVTRRVVRYVAPSACCAVAPAPAPVVVAAPACNPCGGSVPLQRPAGPVAVAEAGGTCHFDVNGPMHGAPGYLWADTRCHTSPPR
jgi:hypothetical protein